MRYRTITQSLICQLLICSLCWSQPGHLNQGVVVTPSSLSSDEAQHLVKVVLEELERRSCPGWTQAEEVSATTPALIFALAGDGGIPSSLGLDLTDLDDEGYAVKSVRGDGDATTCWIVANRLRGLYYGLGYFLLQVQTDGEVGTVTAPLDHLTAPTYRLRGHQLGYRNTANTYDAWTPAQYDQYIRELVLLGSNAVEDIPFASYHQGPHMVMPHAEMHPIISRICSNYDIDYWVWAPGPRDLTDSEQVKSGLEDYRKAFTSLPRLDGVLIPGGDPGHHHPKDLLPFGEKVAAILKEFHPEAGLFISLQRFDSEKQTYFFDYLEKNDPDWLTGVAHGPSSPPVDVERKKLPAKYVHRLYGDLTHTIRCQYPVPRWDQAFALTLGREPTNPQPGHYTQIFHQDMPHTDGFISYSDGAHDDVNKIVWNQLGWDPDRKPRDIILDYCHLFFGSEVAALAADGIFALEHNWEGPLKTNTGVEKTLRHWQQLAAANPLLEDNWRWQQLVMRAHYDTYVRRRLLHEQAIEERAVQALRSAPQTGADQAIRTAEQILEEVASPALYPLRDSVVAFCEKLWSSIGLQSSVERYGASNAQRGAILDFLDYPLCNRWWLEDQFEKVKELADERRKLAYLDRISRWDQPGPGNYYDNISRIGEDDHVTSVTDDAIDFAWWDRGMSRRRLSTQTFQFLPTLRYTGLDPRQAYKVRVAGYGEALIRVNGQRLLPSRYRKGYEEFKEFDIPQHLLRDGIIDMSFDRPDEAHLNWRDYSRVTDVWILKK